MDFRLVGGIIATLGVVMILTRITYHRICCYLPKIVSEIFDYSENQQEAHDLSFRVLTFAIACVIIGVGTIAGTFLK
jgi:hypothetical protein